MKVELAKEFTPADKLGRSAQKDVATRPADYLGASRRMHVDRRIHVATGDGRDRRCA
jgi:hypothetical protein